MMDDDDDADAADVVSAAVNLLSVGIPPLTGRESAPPI